MSLLVVLGTLSIAYLGFAFIAFAALLDNGGTGDILEWMRNPYFSGVLIISSVLLGFLKKTRKRLKNLIADLAENFFFL